MTPTVASDHAFDVDTQVVPAGAGHFAATLTDRWHALGGVLNGGYYVAVCLRALRQALGRPDPLVVSTFFLRPGTPGPVEVRTDVAKGGRRHATGEARLYQDGKELVRTTATFTDLERVRGPEVTLDAPPDLPPPEDAIDPVGSHRFPGVTMTDQVEFRFPDMPGWRDGRPSGHPRAEFWMRFKGREPDAISLPLLVDGAAPVVLELGVAGSATVELTTHVRRRPATGWLACRVTSRHVTGGYHEEDFEIWDSQGHLVAQSRQLALVLTPTD